MADRPNMPRCGAPRAEPLGPYFTPKWGDIPAKRWCIHPSRQKPGWPFVAGANQPTKE